MLRPPIIDAHHSFWDPSARDYPRLADAPPALRRRFGPEELETELRRESVSGTVLVQTLPTEEETADLLALAATVPFVRGVVGWVALTAPDVAQRIARLRAGPGGGALVGLRHRVHDEPDSRWLMRDDVRRGVRATGDAGLAFDLQVRTRELPAARVVCAALPDVHFVLDHLAAPPIASGDLSAWGRELLTLADLPNVSAKLSGLVTEADRLTWSIDDLRHPVELALEAFGAHRLMLGSDWPTCLLAGAYADAIDPIRYLLAGLPDQQQDEIRGATAVHVYRLAERTR